MQEQWLFWYQIQVDYIFRVAAKLSWELEILKSYSISFLSRPWKQLQSYFLILRKKNTSIKICAVKLQLLEKRMLMKKKYYRSCFLQVLITSELYWYWSVQCKNKKLHFLSRWCIYSTHWWYFHCSPDHLTFL